MANIFWLFIENIVSIINLLGPGRTKINVYNYGALFHFTFDAKSFVCNLCCDVAIYELLRGEHLAKTCARGEKLQIRGMFVM